MKKKLLIAGLIVLLVGIVAIIISQTADFRYQTYTFVPNPLGSGGFNMPDYKYNHELQDGLLYGGIVFLVIGSLLSIFSIRK